MARKPRSDSKLAALPKAAKEDLRLWLVWENRTYGFVVEQLKTRHGITTSTGALSNYFRRHLARKRIEEAAEVCESLADVDTGKDSFVKHSLLAIRQRFFDGVLDGTMSIKDIKVLAGIIAASDAGKVKLKELELSERRVELSEKKAAAFDEAKGIAESQLTDAEKGQRMRQLFGMY